jgi:hypothetical protein
MGRAMPCQPDQRLARRASRLVLVGLLAMLVLPVASASASAFTAIARVYAQTHVIPPCAFSSTELATAQSSIPNDAQQYEQDLIAAIEQARQERADGACGVVKTYVAGVKATLPMGTPVPPSAPRLGRGVPLRAGSPIAATASGPPAPIAIVYILGVLLLAAGAVLITARLRGWDPAWVPRVSHSWREAGYRVSGIWSEFGDWLRLGQ